MADPSSFEILVFVLAVVVQTSVLVWGLRTLSTVLKEANGSVARQVFSEKAPPPIQPQTSPPTTPQPTPEPPASFSRVAGGIGAVALASLFVGVSYWVLYCLFWEKSMTRLQELQPFLLSGSALFIPYGFNQLRRVFGG